MIKKSKYSYLFIGLLLISVLVCLFIINDKQDKERLENLVEAEKSEILNYLSNTQHDELMGIYNLSSDYVAVSNNKIYNFQPYDIGEESFKYYEIINFEHELGEKITQFNVNVDSISSFHLITESQNEFLFKTTREYFSKKSPNSGWKSLDSNNSEYYFNYINFSKSIDIIDTFKEFHMYEVRGNIDPLVLLYVQNDQLFGYSTTNFLGNEELKPIELNFDKKIKFVKTVGTSSDRTVILTKDGYIYFVGIYGPIDHVGMESPFRIIFTDDYNNTKISELKIGDLQGQVINFSSNAYYDVISTESATYLYGILPSDVISDGNVLTENIIELTIDNEPVIAKSIKCQDYRECYIQTSDDKIYSIDESRFISGKINFKDNLNLIDLSKEIISNDDIDFNRTFSDSGDFIYTKSGETYFFTNNKEVGNRLTPVPKLQYYQTYQDYLAQRKQEYIDNVDQSVIDGYYESIKDTLPKGNIEN